MLRVDPDHVAAPAAPWPAPRLAGLAAPGHGPGPVPALLRAPGNGRVLAPPRPAIQRRRRRAANLAGIDHDTAPVARLAPSIDRPAKRQPRRYGRLAPGSAAHLQRAAKHPPPANQHASGVTTGAGYAAPPAPAHLARTAPPGWPWKFLPRRPGKPANRTDVAWSAPASFVRPLVIVEGKARSTKIQGIGAWMAVAEVSGRS